MPYAHKAVTVQGVVVAMRALGVADAVLAKVSPDVRAVLENPMTARFHPGAVVDACFTELAAQHGMEKVEQVMAKATEDSLKGIIAPLARLFMTMMGGGPRPLLTRFETLISGGTQGFTAKWEAKSEREGTLRIGSDVALPPISDHAWKGAVTYLLVFAEVKGRVVIGAREPMSREVRLSISWS